MRHRSEWTTDSLHEHLAIVQLERDRRYIERFQAHEIAMTKAFEIAQVTFETRMALLSDEFRERLAQYRRENQLALDSSDKAIAKAEAATEKRFQSVNEFREQLADQTRTFMPRAEAEAAIGRGLERTEEVRHRLSDASDFTRTMLPRVEYDSNHKSLEDRVTAVTDRVNVMSGSTVGRLQLWAVMVAMVATLGTLVVIVNIFTAH